MTVTMDQLAATAIESFRATEELLAELLDYLPCVDENHTAWSPKGATVILEACSQIDSLWKSELRHCHPDKYSQFMAGRGRINVGHYRELIGQRVAWRKILLWSDGGVVLTPFASWRNPQTEPPPTLRWWEAYTNIKHDRLAARRDASILNASEAVGALWISIMNSELCADLVLESNLLSSDPRPIAHPDFESSLELLTKHCRIRGLEASTRLFTYPLVGGLDHAKPLTTDWSDGCGGRFARWHNRNRGPASLSEEPSHDNR